MIFQKESRVLIVVSHPDDEVLGCGGTIARLSRLGSKLHILYLSDGESSRPNSSYKDIHDRRIAAQKAASILGVADLSFESYPDNQMDSIPLLSIVQSIESVINSFAPTIILTHYPYDLNIDHCLTFKSVATACRPYTATSPLSLLSFEIPSSTESTLPSTNVFHPNLYVDISPTLSLKLDALRCYDTEMRDIPHPRSYSLIETLSKYRGSCSGLNHAEAFLLHRHIEA